MRSLPVRVDRSFIISVQTENERTKALSGARKGNVIAAMASAEMRFCRLVGVGNAVFHIMQNGLKKKTARAIFLLSRTKLCLNRS
jgi:hypothetical protein